MDKNSRITIITRESCVYCDNVKKLLGDNGYTYTEQEIGKNIDREFVLWQYPTQKMLPIVVVNDELVGGYIELLDLIHPPMMEYIEDDE